MGRSRKNRLKIRQTMPADATARHEDWWRAADAL